MSSLAVSPLHKTLGPFVARHPKEMVFRPYPNGAMPPMKWAYAADESEDPFKSSIEVRREGIIVPEDLGRRRFSVNTRWYVDGFGFIWLSADNGGEYYSFDDRSEVGALNLNFEFARSRVERNRSVRGRYEQKGTRFSPEVTYLTAISEDFLENAGKHLRDGLQAASLSDRALFYALWAGEKIELEKAAYDIERMEKGREIFIGCETRQYVWARSEEFTKRFVELFNYATITHYVWDTWYELFEPREGVYNWGIKDDIVQWLSGYDITLEGRPLFWFHPTVTPEWLKEKSYGQLKAYMERHVSDLLRHYGDRVRRWEVFNEYHDWANIYNHTPEQITELTRFALETTKQTNPNVVRILNNCCPFGEYVARGRMARMEATRPLRTPRKFLQDLEEAGVEYDVLGIQIYFPQRDLSDIARLLERLEAFNKPIYITEIGASSDPVAPSPSGARTTPPGEPFAWHRQWDEELQADWLEQVYTMYYSRPSIKAISWYDFSDFRPFIVNGGLVREDCSAKQSLDRLKNLLARWGRLPSKKGAER
jgi:endo-1,4-beta-xylanase